jgi:excisionase family DNA binding protein
MPSEPNPTVNVTLSVASVVRAVLSEMDPPTPKRGFTKKEAARYLGLTEWTIDNEVRANRLVGKRRGTTVLFDRAELDRYFDHLPEHV